MPRTIVRNLLVWVPPTLLLAFVGPAVLGARATTAASAAPHVLPSPTRVTGVIRHIGMAGPDRLTPAAIADALVPNRVTPDVVEPASPGARPKVAQPVPGMLVGGATGQEFRWINQDRAANGSRALAWSATLAWVAQYRAQDMLNRNYFSHVNPATGQLAFVELFHAWGVAYMTAGENIAWSTDPSMAGINTMFMNSPEHRDNILNPAYGRVGVGVASDGSKVMVVEVFSN